MTLPLYLSVRELSLEQVRALPTILLTYECDRLVAENNLSFSLLLDPQALYFVARSDHAPFEFDHAKEGFFLEGLWERDVAEIFIGSIASKRYQEFNLSPSGAWWSAIFDSARQRSSVSVFRDGVQTQSIQQAVGWCAALKIPRSSIAVDLPVPHLPLGACDLSGFRVNVCACLGKEKREFLSFAKLPGTTPDFHQPDFFAQTCPLWIL